MIKIVVDKEKIKDFWENKLKPLVARNWWYCTLIVFSSIYLLFNRNTVTGIGFQSVSNVFFSLWVVLLLIPLFYQTDIFGIKEKRAQQRDNSNMQEKINMLQEQIILLQTQNSFRQIKEAKGEVALPSPEELEKTKKMLQEKNVALQSVRKNKMKLEISEEAKFLLEVKYSLNANLKQLCKKMQYEGEQNYKDMAEYLERTNVLDDTLASSVKQVSAICKRGETGEIVSEKYLDFIKQVYPGLEKQMKRILES